MHKIPYEAFLQGVKVKALNWVKPPLSETLSRCETEFGTYRTWTHDEANGKWFWSVEGGYNEVGGSAKDEAAAKAAAQADYEARILSAIEVAPSPRAQALEKGDLQELLKRLDHGLEHEGDALNGQIELFNIEAAEQLFADAAATICALSSQPVADGWLPIETAKKDPNTVILVLLPRMMNLIVRARYNSVHGYWITDCDNDGRISKPTFFHPGDMWHPMPALPASPGASE